MSQEYSSTIRLDDNSIVEVEKAHAAIMAVARRNSKKTPVMNLNVFYKKKKLSGNDILNIMEAYEQEPLNQRQQMQHQMMELDLQIQQIQNEKKEIEDIIGKLNDRLVQLNIMLKNMGYGKGKKKRKGRKSKKRGKKKKKGGTRKR